MSRGDTVRRGSWWLTITAARFLPLLLTNLSDLCHLSHKTATKLYLLNSAAVIEFWKSSNEVSCYPSQYICVPKQPHIQTFAETKDVQCVSKYSSQTHVLSTVLPELQSETKSGTFWGTPWADDAQKQAQTHTHTFAHMTEAEMYWELSQGPGRATQGNYVSKNTQKVAKQRVEPSYVSQIRCQPISPNSSLGAEI